MGVVRRLLLALLAALVTVASIEVGLRVSDARGRTIEAGANRTNWRNAELLRGGIFEARQDADRRYALRPGARVEVDGIDFRINRLRARGPDLPQPKPALERRILTLGDSFCFGMWAAEDETLAGHLARMATSAARARGENTLWRPVNLGTPGYHSAQQAIALEADGLAQLPDVVVLYFNSNDIAREGFFYDEALQVLRHDHFPFSPSWKRFLWRSHLYGFALRAHRQSLLARPYSYLDPSVPWAMVRPDVQSHTRRALERIVALVDQRRIPLFFVHQPLMTWSADVRSTDWPLLPVVEWVEEVRRDLGVPGVSLLGWMRNYRDNVDRFPEPSDDGYRIERFFADDAVQAYFRGEVFEPPEDPDFHLTGDGYGEIARIVYPAMRDASLLP